MGGIRDSGILLSIPPSLIIGTPPLTLSIPEGGGEVCVGGLCPCGACITIGSRPAAASETPSEWYWLGCHWVETKDSPPARVGENCAST